MLVVQRLGHYVEEHQRDRDKYIQLLTFTYKTEVHRSTKTTPFNLGLARLPSSWASPGTAPQDGVSNMDEPRTSVQYESAKLRKLRDALERSRTKLAAARRRYQTHFDKKVRFCTVVDVGDLVHVDRPRRTLTSSERGDLPKEVGGPSVKLLPKTEGPLRIRAAMPTTVVVDQVGSPTASALTG